MINDIWINLPVKDIKATTQFFTALDFEFNEQGSGPNSVSFLVGEKKMVVMFFEDKLFQGFIQTKLADTSLGNEVLFSIGVTSRNAVDELARKAALVGGKVFSKPAEHQGWMYGCGFSDLDGHRWNVLYMDFDSMNQGKKNA